MPAHNFTDISGQVFNRLTVRERTENDKNKNAQWICDCTCGNTTIVLTRDLKSGNTKSCGCLHKESARDKNRKYLTSHGKKNSPEYRIWNGMKNRCLNPKRKDFHNYGGRGITICPRWINSFSDFFADMGERPSPKHSIDRIDNDGEYGPDNCRWSIQLVQSNNKSTSVFITHEGQTHTVAEWARITGIKSSTLYYRVKAGFDAEAILRH